ncbi:MAG: cell division protein ZapA [Anaerovoracaceae bacterium]|jgi:cell division protein ZapA
MDEKAQVSIYGQNYIIAGDESPEEIQKIAEYVDNKMRLVAKMTGKTSGSSIAVLTSVNVAEEYFQSLDEIEKLKAEKEHAEEECEKYERQLEESKKSFEQNKESLQKLKDEKKEQDDRFKDVDKKCSEYENTIFDLQMENIQLKSELEKYKKSAE